MRKVLIALVVLALLAVVGDRVAHKLATDEVQRRLVDAGMTSPQVDVHGFPFLTQVLKRSFDDIDVSATSVQIGTGRAVDVSGTGHDVRVPKNGVATIGRLTGHGTITYAEVLRQVNRPGLTLRSAGSGQVELKQEVSVLGLTYSAVARGRVTAKGDTVSVTPTSVQLAGGGAIDQGISGLIADRLTVSYRIRGMPAGVQIDRITPNAAGFVVDVSGTNVRWQN
jgi:hypothetical protein